MSEGPSEEWLGKAAENISVGEAGSSEQTSSSAGKVSVLGTGYLGGRDSETRVSAGTNLSCQCIVSNCHILVIKHEVYGNNKTRMTEFSVQLVGSFVTRSGSLLPLAGCSGIPH